MDQKCLPSWRNPARYPTSPDADAFVHASHLMGGVHQRGSRRAAHRAAHRGAVGPERSGRSILKITSLCRCAGPQEAAFCVLRAMRHRGCYGISGRVFEHRASSALLRASSLIARMPSAASWTSTACGRWDRRGSYRSAIAPRAGARSARKRFEGRKIANKLRTFELELKRTGTYPPHSGTQPPHPCSAHYTRCRRMVAIAGRGVHPRRRPRAWNPNRQGRRLPAAFGWRLAHL